MEKDNSKLVDFAFPITVTVKPVPDSNNGVLNFNVKSIKRTGEKINFYTYKYKLSNEKLAEYYIDQSIQSLVATPVFGSGLPISNYASPVVDLEDKYLVVFQP